VPATTRPAPASTEAPTTTANVAPPTIQVATTITAPSGY
jgi:hypothetical protein